MAFVKKMDPSLVARAAAGDREATERVLEMSEPLVYRLALGFCGGDGEMAAEVAQEALIAMVRGLGSFRGRASFETWVYRIVRNKCVDSFRRERIRHVEAFEEGRMASRADPEADAQALEARALVHAALGRLSVEHREVIVLFDLEGWSFREISQALDLPVGTVKSRWVRARQKLREVLETMVDLDEGQDGRQERR